MPDQAGQPQSQSENSLGQSSPGPKFNRALRPDAQAFDEVRITTLPRYKESYLSGDEWRISACVQFLRKGVVRHEFVAGTVEAACGLAWGWYHEAISQGAAMFGGEGDFCDQEGCANAATVTYQLKKMYCREGHPTDPHMPTIRRFCMRHRTRGDCGLEDGDSNYDMIEEAR